MRYLTIMNQMRKIFCITGFCLFFFSACQKDDEQIPPAATFINYTIRQGQQFCDQSTFFPVECTELKFVVKFDSSAIYTTIDPINQYDINKLYGFSDNNSDHQKFSARFGWRWSNMALDIFAYVYNDGILVWKKLGTVQIGDENNCSVRVLDQQYIFSLNKSTDTLQRSSTTKAGVGYKLFPFFGGNESAPHDITIKIKEL